MKAKTIATAHTNPRYRWYDNVRDLVIEARLSGNQVRFYEVAPYTVKCIPEELVRNLFDQSKRIVERTFLAKDNPEFFAVLNRNKKKYEPEFKKLISDGNKTVQNQQRFRRTK